MKAFILLFVAFFGAVKGSGFDEDFSRKMVNFTAASFNDPDPTGTSNSREMTLQCFNRSYPNAGFEIVKRFTINPCAAHFTDECQFLIAKSESLKMMVVSFRGTVVKDQFHNQMGDSLEDYLDWEGGNYGKVNKYIVHALDTTWDLLLPNIQNKPDYKIAFTGHSLGGAIASLTALKARVNGVVQDNQTTVYTFGEPRVTDVQLANTFKSYITDMYRVVHSSDLVPHMPLCDTILSNTCADKTGKPYHQPQEIWYNSDNILMSPGEYKSCNRTNGEDPNCSNQMNVVTDLLNMVSDRASNMHLFYYGNKLDEYGQKGCAPPSAPAVREFDENFSRKMVNFAAASFNDPDPTGTSNSREMALQCFNKSYPNAGFEIVKRYTINPCAEHYTDDCQFIITKSESLKMMVIAFRGTVGKDQFHNEMGDSLDDYITWDNGGYGKVNKYFSHALDTTWGYLLPYIQGKPDYKIAFTGHSLGGAIASLTALKARVYGIVQDNQIKVYTFGEPRVGDSALAGTFRRYITDMYRVVHNSDLVPHMPLCKGILTNGCKDEPGKPYHQPQEIWYNNSNLLMSPGQYVSCDPNNGEDDKCSNQISVVEALINFSSDRGADMHLHYYEHKLDEYGPKGCNSAVSIGVSFLTVTLLFLFNLIRH